MVSVPIDSSFLFSVEFAVFFVESLLRFPFRAVAKSQSVYRIIQLPFRFRKRFKFFIQFLDCLLGLFPLLCILWKPTMIKTLFIV